jgi:hypothetical protein
MLSGLPYQNINQSKLLQLRPAPLLIALCTFIALLLALELFFARGFFLQLPLSYQLVHEGDSGAFIANRVSQAGAIHGKTVVFLGGSRTSQAIPSEARYEQLLGVENVMLLSNDTQSLGEALAIVDSLNVPRGSLIIMQSNLERFSFSPADLKNNYSDRRIFGLQHAAQRKILSDLGGKYAPPAWMPNLYQYRSRIAFQVLAKKRALVCSIFMGWLPAVAQRISHGEACFAPVEYAQVIPHDQPMTHDERLLLTKRVSGATRFTGFEKNKDFSIKMVQAIHDVAQRKDLKLVLVHLPIDSYATRLNQPYEQSYRQVVQALERDGIRHIDLRGHPAFSDQDFYDMYHFMESGRHKFEPIIADIVRNNMEV